MMTFCIVEIGLFVTNCDSCSHFQRNNNDNNGNESRSSTVKCLQFIFLFVWKCRTRHFIHATHEYAIGPWPYNPFNVVRFTVIERKYFDKLRYDQVVVSSAIVVAQSYRSIKLISHTMLYSRGNSMLCHTHTFFIWFLSSGRFSGKMRFNPSIVCFYKRRIFVSSSRVPITLMRGLCTHTARTQT